MPYPEDAPPGQQSAILRLQRALAASSAARVGETTVVSTLVHTQDLNVPEDVTAILGSDAGGVFYHRETPGEVLHIDVFHSPGVVDPKAVARNVRAALSGIRFIGPPCGSSPSNAGFIPAYASSIETFLPYFDVQTARGGGRIDGTLDYGQEEGVRAAHRTHVHLTALYTPEVVATMFTLVAAVESAIVESGLELRKVRKVCTVRGSAPVDMSAYQASSDSLLLQSPGGSATSGPAAAFRTEALARQLARDVGSAEEAKAVLEQLAKGMKVGEFSRMRFGPDRAADEVRQALSRSNLMRFDGRKYTLTAEGAGVLEFVSRHSHEVDAYLRRLIWSLPRERAPRGERKGHKTEPCQDRGRGLALPRRTGEPPGTLAVPETVMAAAARTLGIRAEEVRATNSQLVEAGTAVDYSGYPMVSNAVSLPASHLPAAQLPAASSATVPTEPRSESPSTCFSYPPQHRFCHADLRFAYSRERKGGPVILLLDASASMAGRRMRAAKDLARHLVLSAKDKVCILAFQDAGVKVVCPFTRNARKVEEGLSTIQAAGLTPLAIGLEKALELASRSLKKPLVLCVTDGIPTVAARSISPIDDALLAASAIAKRGIRLGCIGLEPNSGFLRQMAEKSKGTLYVVEELEASTMAAIARREAIR